MPRFMGCGNVASPRSMRQSVEREILRRPQTCLRAKKVVAWLITLLLILIFAFQKPNISLAQSAPFKETFGFGSKQKSIYERNVA